MPNCVPRYVSNEIDYGKKNVEINSGIHQINITDMEILRNIDVPLVFSLLTLKIFQTC